ncbi:hypothetical protein CPC08DRAFT_651049 [Agrocybe pediades]|nr:hypothetical protein CPC08DRAFT_651049 [Agrocybe pediades]
MYSCYYPDGSYDPEDLENGLFRNPIAIRVFKHLFISPQSALQDGPRRPKSKPGQAKLNNMTEVTPGSIAYTFTLFRHSITAINDWRDDEDLYDRRKGYFAIRNAFELEDENTWQPWAKDTLDFWTK